MISLYYKSNDNAGNAMRSGSKIVRIMVVGKDSVYYSETDKHLLDTPFVFEEEYSERVSIGEAKSHMSERIGFLNYASVRFCYRYIDAVSHKGIEHFLCFVDSKDGVEAYERASGKKGVWLSKQEIDRKFQQKKFTNIASSELYRIYTTMLTSKKYDIDGRRKVRLKGYSPSFAIEELRTTDVDFSDNRWMVLSKFNRRSVLVAMKMAWYKYIEGLG